MVQLQLYPLFSMELPMIIFSLKYLCFVKKAICPVLGFPLATLLQYFWKSVTIFYAYHVELHFMYTRSWSITISGISVTVVHIVNSPPSNGSLGGEVRCKNSLILSIADLVKLHTIAVLHKIQFLLKHRKLHLPFKSYVSLLLVWIDWNIHLYIGWKWMEMESNEHL